MGCIAKQLNNNPTAQGSHPESRCVTLYRMAETLIKYPPLQYNSALDFNCLPVKGDFCRLLAAFANSLDQVRAPQNVGPNTME